MANRSWGTASATSVLALLLLALGACTTTTATGSIRGLPTRYGRLSGSVGPGAPPNGTIPNLVLTFSNGTTTLRATVIDGKYQIDLPAGTWDVRSEGLCATGLSVTAGAWQQDGLVYPTAQCQSLAGPPTSTTS